MRCKGTAMRGGRLSHPLPDQQRFACQGARRNERILSYICWRPLLPPECSVLRHSTAHLEGQAAMALLLDEALERGGQYPEVV